MAVRLSTKAAALVYLLSIVEPNINLLDKSISEEFDISLTTIKNYYTIIVKYKEHFIDIFDKYNYTQDSIKPKKRAGKVKKII